MIEFLDNWGGILSGGVAVIIIIGGAIYAMEHSAPFDVDDHEEERPMTRRQYESAMYQIEMLMKSDPPLDSEEGKRLTKLVERAEEYERRQGWMQ